MDARWRRTEIEETIMGMRKEKGREFAKGEREKKGERKKRRVYEDGLRGCQLWIIRERLREERRVSDIAPICLCTAAFLQHRLFVRASVKGNTEYSKGIVFIRHDMRPMLPEVAMGMLLTGWRTNRCHENHGATTIIAHRPHPYLGPTTASCYQYHHHTMQLTCMYLPIHVRARENPHDCGLSRRRLYQHARIYEYKCTYRHTHTLP